MAYLLHSVSEHDLFADIGSNVGSYTLLACAARGARGICFEPVPQTYRRLMDNRRLNDHCASVTAPNLGVADKDGELLFTAGENYMNHVIAEGESAGETVKVKVVTLDSALASQCPAIIKIDVEGFDTLVLRGAAETLANPTLHSVIIELNGGCNRYGFDEDAIVATLKTYGFDSYSYEPFSRTLTSLNGGRNATGNTLFIRGIEQARQRSAAAAQVVIRNCRF